MFQKLLVIELTSCSPPRLQEELDIEEMSGTVAHDQIVGVQDADGGVHLFKVDTITPVFDEYGDASPEVCVTLRHLPNASGQR